MMRFDITGITRLVRNWPYSYPPNNSPDDKNDLSPESYPYGHLVRRDLSWWLFCLAKTRIQLIRKEMDREADDGSTRAETVANSGEVQKERLKFPAVT